MLAPELFASEDADYSCSIDTNEVVVILYSLPETIVSCPVEYRAILTTFLAVDAYVKTVRTEQPDHDWGVKNPERQMTLDALKMKPKVLDAARRALWN
jgi:hypothetical protein